MPSSRRKVAIVDLIRDFMSPVPRSPSTSPSIGANLSVGDDHADPFARHPAVPRVASATHELPTVSPRPSLADSIEYCEQSSCMGWFSCSTNFKACFFLVSVLVQSNWAGLALLGPDLAVSALSFSLSLSDN
jgi:hypothetical protein